MITYLCTKENCNNKDLEYNSLGNSPTAECGGCKTILQGTNERPDPVVEAPQFGVPEQD